MGSKQTKKEKQDEQINPIQQVNTPEPKHEVEYELSERKGRNDQLKNPDDHRPIELSYLQQTNNNNTFNRMHHDEPPSPSPPPRRIPIAINRWPKDNDQGTTQKTKTFIEEYVHQ